ncbi:MAG: NEW3 domain-containing protein, partial [Candidatus Aenigmatarchaeota archaeon]
MLLLVLAATVGAVCIPNEGLEMTCDDGLDNDCDGLADSMDTDCELVLSDYEITGGPLTMVQGDSTNLDLMLANTGSVPLELTMEIVGPQEIMLSAMQKFLELGPKDRQSLNVNVNVPLNTKPGDYHVTFKFKGPPNKDNVVVVTVKQNPIIGMEMPALENSLNEFNEMLDKLEASGIDVKDSMKRSEDARRKLD